MLSQFRTLAQTPVAKVLFGVLAVSFVIWGVRGAVTSGGFSDAVIRADGRTISSPRFRQMFQEELQQYSQQSGQTLTVPDALAHHVDRQVADGIAGEEAMAAYLARIGIRPSDQQVVGEITKAPRFFNPVTGVFDKDGYKQFVQGLGLTDAEFENILRDQIAQTQFISAIAAGLRAPLLFPALQAVYENEGRTFSYFVLPPSAVPAPAQPTDAQLNGFIKDHADQLTRPEARVFTVAAFSSQKLAQTTAADPAEVQKRFDFEKDTLSTPEKRSLVEIPVRSAADGQAVAARLHKGEDPQAVAKSLNVQPAVYNDSPKTAVADKKIADLAFAMQPGQVQGPVQGDLGQAVIKLLKVTPGHQATLDEVRSKIENEVKLSQAQAQVNKAVQSYEAKRSGGTGLPDAAKAAGATVSTLPPITAQATTLQNQRVNIPPKLLQAGFALKPGQDSDIVDLGQGEYAALRLEKVVPPSPPPLAEIRDQLVRFVMQQDLMKRLQAKADAIAAGVSKGQSLEAAAAANHLTVQHAPDVLRSAAGKTFSTDLLSKIFLGKPGDVVDGSDVKPGFVVAKLEAVVPATPQAAAQATANGRDAATQAEVQDFAAAVRSATREVIKPKVDYAKAHQALAGGAQ
jgi:peptidyl-prolyl cis-trans isomerase D